MATVNGTKKFTKFQLPMYKYVCQTTSCYPSVLNTCHYASFLCFLSLSLAAKYQNHFKGKDLSLIWENSQPLLLQIFLLPLSLLLLVSIMLHPLSLSQSLDILLHFFHSIFSLHFSFGCFYWHIFKITDSFADWLLATSLLVSQSHSPFWSPSFWFLIVSFSIPAYIVHLFLQVVHFFH